jgi:DNA-directed RNA polymerase specialized sigma54-like protein
LLFVALVLHSPVVKDFLAEVVNDLRRQFKEKLLDGAGMSSTSHLRQQPVLTSYSDSSIKNGNNLVKALAEAGYLDTPRRRNLQSVFLLPETQATLQRLGQQNWFLFWRGNGDRSRA